MIIIVVLDWVGRITAVMFLVTVIGGIIAWSRGILLPLIRLGNGLARCRIALFAKGDNLKQLENLLSDSKLFKKNIIGISSESDFGRADRARLFLVYWPDWSDKIGTILNAKNHHTALIVYAPRDMGSLPPDKVNELNMKSNVTLVNFRGRLLNDVIISLITTSYQ